MKKPNSIKSIWVVLNLKKNNFIVEIKSSKTDSIEEKILDEFPFISSRISKYCDSINSLNLFN